LDNAHNEDCIKTEKINVFIDSIRLSFILPFYHTVAYHEKNEVMKD